MVWRDNILTQQSVWVVCDEILLNYRNLNTYYKLLMSSYLSQIPVVMIYETVGGVYSRGTTAIVH